MKTLLALLPVLTLTACLAPSGGSGKASADTFIAPSDGTSGDSGGTGGGGGSTPPAWSAPANKNNASTELRGTYVDQSNSSNSIAFAGDYSITGQIATTYLHTVSPGVTQVRSTTCSFTGVSFHAEDPTNPAADTYDVWADFAYNLSPGGTWSTVHDCQLNNQANPTAETQLVVTFVSETCIKAKLVRDTTTGRTFCK